jgi:hypothetical protein
MKIYLAESTSYGYLMNRKPSLQPAVAAVLQNFSTEHRINIAGPCRGEDSLEDCAAGVERCTHGKSTICWISQS